DRHKANLGCDSLTRRANREIEKLLGYATRFPVCVIEGGPCVGISFGGGSLRGRNCAIDCHGLDSAGLSIGEADIANAIGVLAYFRRDLFVPSHLLRARRII